MVDYSDLIGTPFKLGGRDKKTGLDCYGLVTEIYKRHGINIPEYNEQYNTYEKASELIGEARDTKILWKEADSNNLPIPCVMAIRFNAPKGIINHTAVYIGDGKFIHAREKVGVCVDRISSPAWRRIIEGYYKYVGDDNGENSNN